MSYRGIFCEFKHSVFTDYFRANGAFLVDASLENGRIRAEILSEQGMPLTVEAPDSGYILVTGDGRQIPVTEGFVTVSTEKGERVTLRTE